MQVPKINDNNNRLNFGAKIVSIHKNDVLNSDKLRALSYIVRNRRGYQHSLHNKFNIDSIESLKTVGFMNTGHTLKFETYSVTNLGDQYYKDMFGITSYYTERVVGFLKKFFKFK